MEKIKITKIILISLITIFQLADARVAKKYKSTNLKANTSVTGTATQIKPKNYYLKTKANQADYQCKTDLLDDINIKANFYCKDKRAIVRNKPLYGTHKNINLPSSYVMPTVFFNRSSDILLILGPGYNRSKESMACFVELFNQYDILVFDYRWTVNKCYKLYPKSIFRPIKSLLLDEIEEVEHAISYATSLKKYKQVVGLGECYSCFLFALAQLKALNQNKKLFTKLILDSCWLSISAFAQVISQDPLLPINRAGGFPRWLVGLFNITGIIPLIRWTTTSLWSDVDVSPILAQLHNTPMLFIHGQNDNLVPLGHFDTIFASSGGPSVAVLTPYTHSRNLHDREIYRFICEQFIEQKFKDYLKIIKHKIALDQKA